MKPFPVSNIATAKYIKRDGNQALWVVSFGAGDNVTVRTHAMCNEKTAVRRALAQRTKHTHQIGVDEHKECSACYNNALLRNQDPEQVANDSAYVMEQDDPTVQHRLAIDAANAEWVKGNPETRNWPNNQNTGGAESERG